MGKVGQFITGGSRAKNTSSSASTSLSDSSNRAFDFIKDSFGGATENAGKGMDAISALLGLGGDTEGQTEAFDNFRNSSGYKFQMDEGKNAIESSAASRGLLHSGATAKALTKYGQGLANSSLSDYLNQLRGVADSGYKAGELISGAGNVSHSEGSSTSVGKGTSSTKPGIGQFIGQIISGAAGGG